MSVNSSAKVSAMALVKMKTMKMMKNLQRYSKKEKMTN